MTEKTPDTEDGLMEFSAFNRVALGVFVIGSDFKVLFWNKTIEEWTGKDADKMVGTYISDYFPKFKEPRYIHRIEDIFNGAPPAIFSSQLHGNFMPLSLPDGTTRVKHVTVSSVKTSNDDEGYSALFVIQDVSDLTRRVNEYRSMHERAETELALREEAEKGLRLFRDLIDSSNDAIFVIEPSSGSLLDANDEAARSLGYSREELLKLKITDTEENFLEDRSWRSHVESIKSAGSMVLEGRHRRRDGTGFPVERSIRYLRHMDSDYIVVTVRDITERKKAEEALRKSEAQFKTLVSNIPGVVYRGNNDEHWTMHYISDNVEELVGYPASAFIDNKEKTFTSIIHPDDAEHVDRVVQEGINNRQSYFIDYRVIHKDGTVKHVYEQGRGVFAEDGELLWLDGAIFDITDRKRAEEALVEAKDEAEKATETKDKFVSLVSHDMKGPLHVVRGYLEILEEGGHDPALSKEMIKEALATCDDMGRLIKDILNLSKIKGGEISPKRLFLSARRVGNEAVKSYSLIAKQKGIEIVNDIPGHARIHADEELIVEVVRNLVSNAVKFCDRGGKVILALSSGEGNAISVTDTGVGINAARYKKLFKYEEKTSTRGTSGEGGTGFGLPLAKDIVEAHGGRLDVESVVGKGSTFSINLPYRRPRVLIADDSGSIREILKGLLEEMDVDTVEASSGEEAMKRLDGIEESPVDLILLDINMPGISGADLLKRVKSRSELKELPVVIITGEDTTETRESMFRMGADDFVAKPLKGEDLIPRLRRLIG